MSDSGVPLAHQAAGAYSQIGSGGGLDEALAGGSGSVKYGGASAAETRRKWKFVGCASVVLLVLAVLLFAYANPRSGDQRPAKPEYDVRLPTAVEPTHYYLDLNASVAAERFNGRMVMDLFFASETSEIIFHAVELDISEVQFTAGANSTVCSEAAYVGEHDLYRVALPFRVAAGTNAKLSMQFAGIISHGLGGQHRLTACGCMTQRTIP
jgi:hypothetical protein